MNHAVCIALAFALTLGWGSLGCTVQEDSCQLLTERLNECGLVVAEPNCEALSTSAQASLLESMADGCLSPELVEDGAFTDEICEFAGWPCPDAIGPEPTASPTQHTILFVGGIDDTPVFDWSARIVDTVASVHDAHHVPLSAFGTVDQRALDLHYAIENLSAGRPDRRYNLVCYAVGGRDCRYLVSPGGLFRDDPETLSTVQQRVASITTVATPHRGTRLAEAAILAMMGKLEGVSLEAFGVADLAGEGLEASPEIAMALMKLTPQAALLFNSQVPDAQGIYYQSYAGISGLPGDERFGDDEVLELCQSFAADGDVAGFYGDVGRRDVLNPALWGPSAFAAESFDPNGVVRYGPSDGQVSVFSAPWGRFRGCLPTDHWDVIDQIAHFARDPMTGFSAPRFYLQLADDLRDMGF